MIRMIWAATLTLGLTASVNGVAAAGDDGPTRPDFGTTMTLGGQGTAAQAAAAEDVELAHGYRYGYRPYYGGFRPYYGGFGYGGFGYRPYGYFNPYRVGYYGGFRPYYRPYFGYARYYGGFGGYYPWYGGYYCGISGNETDASAPVITLAMKVADAPFVRREAGGDVGKPAAPAVSLPVSMPTGKPASPYIFKAFGEK